MPPSIFEQWTHRTRQNSVPSPLTPLAQLVAGVEMKKLSKTGHSSKHTRVWLDMLRKRVVWHSKKPISLCSVNLDSVTEIRPALTIPHGNTPETELSIHYSTLGRPRVLNLIAPTPDLRDAWVDVLTTELNKDSNMSGRDTAELVVSTWIQRAWQASDRNSDHRVDCDELAKLLKSLNINVGKHEVKSIFAMYADGKGFLTFRDFSNLFRHLLRRSDVDALFRRLCRNTDRMSYADFRNFLLLVQKETHSEDNLLSIFADFAVHDETGGVPINYAQIRRGGAGHDSMYMDPTTFQLYLQSQYNSVSPLRATVTDDMTQPLSHYFCSSSHNTYLRGNQLNSSSSVEQYIRTLQDGCRCVELDCWDGPNGEPIITHGHTLTSKIFVRDVLIAIEKYAFVASDYPLVLSLEMHCSVAQQGRVAAILREVLGPKLLTVPVDPGETQLPSPHQLRERIIVKCVGIVTGPELPTQDFEQDVSPPTNAENEPSRALPGSIVDPLSRDIGDLSVTQGHGQVKPDVPGHPDMLALVVYMKTVKFTGFPQAAEHARVDPKFFCTISSFSESAGLKLTQAALSDFVAYNTRRVSRVYPAGLRVQSSNYDPFPHWYSGSQLVALNWQTYDRGMQLQTGFFNRNGRCGYVLKPSYMLPDTGRAYKPQALTLAIEIVSAQHLALCDMGDKTRDIVDPYVEVEIIDAVLPSYLGHHRRSAIADNSHVYPIYKHVTRVVDNNGWNPVWQEKCDMVIRVPEMAMVRFVVRDRNGVAGDELVGAWSSVVSALPSGYRHLPLTRYQGQASTESTLFMNLNVRLANAGRLAGSIASNSSDHQRTRSILDRHLNKSRNDQVSVAAFAFLFSEAVQYTQKRVTGIADLEKKLNALGYRVGQRYLELLFYRDRGGTNAKRETRVLQMLIFINTVVWKALFGKQADGLEKSTENEDEYMISDNDLLVNRFISVPRELSQLNAGAFVAGVVEAILHGSQFPARVTAHTVPIEGQPNRTTVLIKFEASVLQREALLDGK
ncbi:hypothetical protein RI367_004657 [Sorochytrium milnesiophthora]